MLTSCRSARSGAATALIATNPVAMAVSKGLQISFHISTLLNGDRQLMFRKLASGKQLAACME